MTDFEAQMRIIMYYMVMPCAVAIAIGYLLEWQEKRNAKKNKPKNTFKNENTRPGINYPHDNAIL